MPYQPVDRDIFLEHNGVVVYHSYKGNQPSRYWYVVNGPDDEPLEFDVRNIDAPLTLFEHAAIIRHAIDSTTWQTLLATARPAEEAPEQWVDNEPVLTVGEHTIYRAYDHTEPLPFGYTFANDDDDLGRFDLRNVALPASMNVHDLAYHPAILRYALDHGLLDTYITACSSPYT